ncbi:unnamed protein product [Staurois parvus]|uniref:Secreted protein n=1 Tax=Staurois parvus TaxID=386267 RepID=A0ABN9HTK0_9NEOB|nr:unnamed protein product [Staurois parvus]
MPWAPYRLLMLLARPVICHGPTCTASSLLLPGSRGVCHGSLYGLPLLLSPSPHSAMCHTFRSPHHCWWFHFVIGCCMASHLLPPPPHCGSTTLGFGPVDCPNENVVKCAVDSRSDGTHLHVLLTDSIISLPQQTPRGI